MMWKPRSELPDTETTILIFAKQDNHPWVMEKQQGGRADGRWFDDECREWDFDWWMPIPPIPSKDKA